LHTAAQSHCWRPRWRPRRDDGGAGWTRAGTRRCRWFWRQLWWQDADGAARYSGGEHCSQGQGLELEWLTPEEFSRRASGDEGSRDRAVNQETVLRCITRGVVGSILPVLYGNGVRILQTPSEVVLSYEMVHDTRVIPVDGRPAASSRIKYALSADREYDRQVAEAKAKRRPVPPRVMGMAV
jgi:hypothetical protein